MIDDEQLFNLVPVQDLARLVQRRAHRHGVERLLRHHLGDRASDVRLESQIAIGQDPDQSFLASVIRDWNAEMRYFFISSCASKMRFEGKRDRIDDHPALGALHAVDLEMPARQSRGSCG